MFRLPRRGPFRSSCPSLDSLHPTYPSPPYRFGSNPQPDTPRNTVPEMRSSVSLSTFQRSDSVKPKFSSEMHFLPSRRKNRWKNPPTTPLNPFGTIHVLDSITEITVIFPNLLVSPTLDLESVRGATEDQVTRKRMRSRGGREGGLGRNRLVSYVRDALTSGSISTLYRTVFQETSSHKTDFFTYVYKCKTKSSHHEVLRLGEKIGH